MLDCKILIIEDEDDVRKCITAYFQDIGYPVVEAANGREGLEIFYREKPHIVFTDLRMPVMGGFGVITELSKSSPCTPVVVISGIGVVKDAVEALRLGAFDYVVKPIHEMIELELIVKKAMETTNLRSENASLKQKLLTGYINHQEAFAAITTQAPAMLSIFQYLEVTGASSQPILINGETGVGKELLANAIHKISGRTGGLVATNVAGLDDQMFSDTLFGHTKGAFTGADHVREGLLAQAREGTIFLDEIGDLSESSQIKLLRLLQDGEYYPIGSDFPKKSCARIVVATHRDLRAMVDQGTFRQDLYYRLYAHQVTVPPLRERSEDIPLLLDQLLQEAATALSKNKPTPPPELCSYLAAYSFPGNVRQLKAMVFDAVARHKKGVLSLDSFKAIIGAEVKGKVHPKANVPDDEACIIMREPFGERVPTLKEAETTLIAQAMKLAKGNQGIAANYLGINRSALNKKLLKLKRNNS